MVNEVPVVSFNDPFHHESSKAPVRGYLKPAIVTGTPGVRVKIDTRCPAVHSKVVVSRMALNVP